MRKITLELDEEQALSLLVVTQLVGGHPDTTRRRHIDEIAQQIGIQVGYNIYDEKLHEFVEEITDQERNSIYFNEGMHNPFKNGENNA